MLRRLALALLLIFVAMPSAAAPPCSQTMNMGPMAMAGMHHDSHPMDDRAGQADQHCIGCAIPAAPAVPTVSPEPLAKVVLAAERMATLVAHARGPDTPPPRA